QLARGAGDPLRRHPAQGLGWEPDLGGRAGASRADVGVADVLATGALGPGLLELTPSRHTSRPGLAPVTHRANSRSVNRRLGYRLPAGSTPQSNTTFFPGTTDYQERGQCCTFC